MGIRDWFARKPQIVEVAIDEYPIDELIAACAALDRGDPTVFDQPAPTDRAGLRQRCIDKITTLLPDLDREDLVATIDQLAETRLPINCRPFLQKFLDLDVANEAAIRTTLRSWARDNELGLLSWACIGHYDDATEELAYDLADEIKTRLIETARSELRSILPTPTAADYAIARRRLTYDLDDEIVIEPPHLVATDTSPAIAWPPNPGLDEEGDALAILADWYQQHDHPQGKLIALTLAGPALEAEVRSHVSAHANTLLGPLAKYRVLSDGNDYGIQWRRGRIDRALISLADPDALAILDHLLLHKSLRELAIGVNIDDEHLVERAIWLVANRPHELSALHFCDLPDAEHKDVPYHAVALGDLLELPSLKTFVALGKSYELASLELPNIERFAIETFDDESLEVLASAEWDKLQSLELWCDFIGADDLAMWLQRITVPSLRHLALIESDDTDQLVEAIVEFEPAVKELDLAFGNLTDAGARALAAARLRLERLDVTRNRLTRDGIDALRSAYPVVTAFEQHDRTD